MLTDIRHTIDTETAIQSASFIRRTHMVDFLHLTKPEITLLSVATAAAGAYISDQNIHSYSALLHTIAGTALAGAGAGTLNEYLEWHYDGQMKRTARRPLPMHRIAPASALAFGTSLSIAGVGYLFLFTNILAAILAAFTITSYLFLYTPLKRRTPFAIVIGGVPGALPPLIGWAASSGSVSVQGLSLYFILFFWQMPHFLALSWMYRKDYARAGYKTLTAVDETGGLTCRQMIIYATALVPASAFPTLVGLAGVVYFGAGILLSLGFLLLVLKFCRTRTNSDARRLFYASLIYLPAVFFIIALG